MVTPTHISSAAIFNNNTHVQLVQISLYDYERTNDQMHRILCNHECYIILLIPSFTALYNSYKIFIIIFLES